MKAQVDDIVLQYKDLETKWNTLDKFEEGQWNSFKKLTLKQQLKSIMDNLNTE